ncbi:uncharacterized protein LOC107479400 [Arachis duranensis]|uniref:DNA polymerase delta catalytic subunit n=1 Tax=Arachis duranensis TaxID=130453 RepID=A0A6P5NG48_ARADU|nr:uncharacterized protein LOC107479400 [Arachis duranensis]
MSLAASSSSASVVFVCSAALPPPLVAVNVRVFVQPSSSFAFFAVQVFSAFTVRVHSPFTVRVHDFIHEVDPDIIIGYNICKFDLPYLIERAQALKIAEFPILGRIRNSRVRVKDTTFSSRQYGTRESKKVAVEGRVQFDLLQVSFTGSMEVGREIMHAAASSNLKQVSLELVGKSPLLIFDDADVDKAASLALLGIVYNKGEICVESSVCLFRKGMC